MSQILEIRVYDKDGQITKTVPAETLDLTYGQVRSIMEILNVDDVSDTSQLLQKVMGAWDQLTRVLSECFPGMDHDDWEYVKLKELIPVLISVLRYSFSEILTIPKSKN